MSRLTRKNALPIADVLKEFIKASRLDKGLNNQIVFSCWDDVSGAAKYTTRKFFRDGTLYVTMSSSVIRSQLAFQKDALLEKLNAKIAEDELFTGGVGDEDYVKALIIK